MIHYHGTPITPRAQLQRMAGRHFCVSFASPQDLQTCLSIGQSVMLDCGAFSAYTRGVPLDIGGYFKWLEPILSPPHWCIIPDVIDGTLEDQYAMLSKWPREVLGYDNAASVFHIHMPLSHLHFLCNAHPRVCLGSSGEYWQIGTAKWIHRIDEIFNYLSRNFRTMPYIHGLRMLSQVDGGWPFASADSTNVGQNFKKVTGCAECMAERIDGEQPSLKWKIREQGTLL